MDFASIRRKLAVWYEAHQRDLPWRRTRDPYRIWISEIMLQQTRVAAVIPYYERFLRRFPDVDSLAQAPEQDVLAAWSGLGYYSRARNLQAAAKRIAANGSFPRDHAAIRDLPGIGDYTAAAVGSIAFGLPYASVDGNVRRVIMRLAGSADVDVAAQAQSLLDSRNPGRSNQALMELGATVCTPAAPLCGSCPVRSHCAARELDLVTQLPPPKVKPATVQKMLTLLIIRRPARDGLLLVPSPRVQGFWELPEPFPGIRMGGIIATFRHSITNTRYVFEVREATTRRLPPAGRWWTEEMIVTLPISTASKKALQCFHKL